MLLLLLRVVLLLCVEMTIHLTMWVGSTPDSRVKSNMELHCALAQPCTWLAVTGAQLSPNGSTFAGYNQADQEAATAGKEHLAAILQGAGRS